MRNWNSSATEVIITTFVNFDMYLELSHLTQKLYSRVSVAIVAY